MDGPFHTFITVQCNASFRLQIRCDEFELKLARFVNDQFPTMRRMETDAELTRWWKAASTDRPKMVITGSTKTASLEFMQVERLAHMWAGHFDFAFADPKLVRKSLGDAYDPKYEWLIATKSGAVEESKTVLDVDMVAGAMQELVAKAMTSQAPSVTVRNYQQLCGAHVTRTICLFLVDQDASRVRSALEELNASRVSYAQEVQELRASDEGSSDEESTEEKLNIQIVRVTTSSSRLPWNPVAVGNAFESIWAQADHSRAFAFELDGRRFAAIKSASLRELYQSIAYDDVTFRDIPEDVSLARALPDPEASLRREFNRLLYTIPGSLLAFVFVAVVLSVVPEVPLAQTGALVGAVSAVLVVVWPLASRKAISLFWCIVSPSSFECQCG